MERTFDTPGGLDLDLTIPAGEITVRAADTPVTTLRIEGVRDLDDLRIDLAPTGGGRQRLVVAYRAKKAWGLFSLGHDLDIDVTVPLGTAVNCSAGTADAKIEGGVGSLTVQMGSGDVRFDEVTGNVSVKTGSGDVSGGSVGGDLTTHGASGDVRVSRVVGSLVARTASGNLRIDEATGVIHATAVSGDLEIRSIGGPRAEMRSVSGDVEVGVPAGRGVYLDLSSTTGDVRSDLDAAPTPSDGPDLELSVSTVSGDVRVRRAAAPATELS
jgi:DUF4097 and DUF4098 domain-containing protein YvlB